MTSRPFRMLFVLLCVLLLPGITANSCGSIQDCKNCTDTYRCHWCDHDQTCHVKGSLHGCAWGSTCKADNKPTNKENTTCHSHTTCSECALSSHLCHWCEYDNACHAIGSRYGCTSGVDCYSNDRCRRKEPEKFEKFILTEIPQPYLIILLVVATILIGCFTCCYWFVGNLRGAYNDLATIAASVSLRPPSMIGGTIAPADTSGNYYSALEIQPEEEEEEEFENEESNNENENDNAERQIDEEEGEENRENEYAALENDDNRFNTTGSYHDIPGMQESRHLRAICRTFSCCYFFSVLLVITLTFGIIYFYPSMPVYSVCNDAIGWSRIIAHIVALRIDASFEILNSLSNPTRVTVALDSGIGTFTFDGDHLGTFEIPPFTAEAMAITDFMIISRVTPDKSMAVKIARAYMKGNLLLEAEFDATLRLPTLLNFTRNVTVSNIPVDISAMADRSLCHCPSWDDNHTTSAFQELLFHDIMDS